MSRPAYDGTEYGFTEEAPPPYVSPLWGQRRADILKRHPDARDLLEIGCNYGLFLQACAPDFRVVGIDASQYALSLAQNRVNADLFHADVSRGLPFADASFDAVALYDVLEHVADYRGLLAEIYRVLRSQGIIALTTPNRWSINSLLFGKDYWLKRDPTHQFVLSRGQLVRDLKKIGFKRIEVRSISLLHFLADIGIKGRSAAEPNSAGLLKNSRGIKRLMLLMLKWGYNLINDLRTPWGANLYAIARK